MRKLVVLFSIAWVFFASVAFPASDNFDRIDANPISGSWMSVNLTADNQIISNAAHPTLTDAGGSPNGSITSALTASPDQYSQVGIAVLTGTAPYAGVILRGDSATGDFYFCAANASSETLILVHPSYTLVLLDVTVTWAPGDTIYCEISGVEFIIKKNGTTVLTVTDATLATGQPGIFMAGQSSVFDVAVDNWDGGNLGAAPVANARRAIIVQ